MASNFDNSNWINTAKSFAFRTTASAHNLFDSLRSKIPQFDGNKKTLPEYPVILLETIGNYGMRNVMAFSYIIFIVCLIITLFERSFHTETIYFNRHLDFNQTNLFPNTNPVKWTQEILVHRQNRFFKLYAYFTPKSIPTESFLNLNFLVSLSARPSDSADPVFNRTFSAKVAYQKKKNGRAENIEFLSEEGSPFGFYWQDELFEKTRGELALDVSVELADLKTDVAGPLRLFLAFSMAKKGFLSKMVAFEALLVAAMVVVFLGYCFRIKTSDRVITEQKLLLLLFSAVVMFQVAVIMFSMPFEARSLALVTSRRLYMIIGNIVQKISFILLGCFVLLMADVINCSSVNYSLHEHLTMTKASLVIINSITSLLATTIFTFWELSRHATPHVLVTYLYIASYSVCLITTFLLVLWVLQLFWSAYRELQYWNYKATRFRQLSFRFFATQCWFVALYLAVAWAVWSVFGEGANPLSGIGTSILLSTYTAVCAFVHLPLGEQIQSEYVVHRDDFEDIGFSLEVARLMCNLSWQVYGIPSSKEEKESDPSSSFKIDLNALGMKLRRIGTNAEYDVQWMVAEGENIVAVAFRGSISFVNVGTNLRIYHCLVNNNFWYTGDLRYVSPSQQTHTDGATQVHAGFMRAYLAVRREVFAALCAALAERSAGATLYVTGHSLGAALATLCALEAACRLDARLRVYTFGSPRVGAPCFAQLFRHLLPRGSSFRLSFEGDLAASYPAALAAYRHVETEVYVDRSGNLLFAPNFVERSLLPAKTRLDQHSLALYRAAIETACAQYGLPGERDDECGLFGAGRRNKMEFGDGI